MIAEQRIVSLVPSATEMLFALGLGDQVVGVTHECDFPDDVLGLPRLTRSVLAAGMAPDEIDRAVRDRVDQDAALYELDDELLCELEPTLIVTQALCAVCAVSFDDVRAVAARLPGSPPVISLDPTTIGEVLGDVRTLANAAGIRDGGADLVRSLADRIDDVRIALGSVGGDDGPPRPRVAALEWLDPPYLAGHWVPQMIELAGGEDVLGLPGERSRVAAWDEIAAIEPEIVIAMPCGYDTGQAAEEAERFARPIARLGGGQVFACDAAAYFSRPGPRLIDGLEMLAHALHPGLVDEPAAGRMLKI